MGLFNWFFDLFDNSDDINSDSTNLGVNPATGLPMMDDSMIDVGGNPYGTDLNDDSATSTSAFDDDDSSFGGSGGGGFATTDFKVLFLKYDIISINQSN